MPVITKQERSATDLSYARILYHNKISSADSSDAAAVLIPNTWERYESASGTVSEDFSFSSASTINAVGIAAHNLATAGAVLTVGLSTTDPYSTVVKTLSITPTDNRPILFLFDDEDDILTMRITLTGGTNREIGVIYAGEALVMQRAIYGGHNPITLNSVTEYRNALSETGQFLERKIKRKGQQSNFNWQYLEPEWYRDNFQPFVNSAKTAPFFIKWRPDYNPDEVAFGYTTQDIRPSNMGGGVPYLSVSMNMRAHDE